jgi:hypothetical protein
LFFPLLFLGRNKKPEPIPAVAGGVVRYRQIMSPIKLQSQSTSTAFAILNPSNGSTCSSQSAQKLADPIAFRLVTVQPFSMSVVESATQNVFDLAAIFCAPLFGVIA